MALFRYFLFLFLFPPLLLFVDIERILYRVGS
jgi:hypothetical protein